MSKKKVRKKHNPKLREMRLIDAFVKDKALIYVEDANQETNHNVEVIKLSTGEPVYPTVQQVKYFSDKPHLWCFHVAVMGTDTTGKDYMKTSEYPFVAKLHQTDITDYIKNELDLLLANFNQNHYTHKGWIAVPYHTEFEPEHVSDLYTKWGWNETNTRRI